MRTDEEVMAKNAKMFEEMKASNLKELERREEFIRKKGKHLPKKIRMKIFKTACKATPAVETRFGGGDIASLVKLAWALRL